MRPMFEHLVLNKHQAIYLYCEESGLLAVEKPHWLAEAYSEAIVNSDTGVVARNIHNCSAVIAILGALRLTTATVLDVAGGYGLLTRMLRDSGVDCYSTDKYCKNIFAAAFEPQPGFCATVLCAFEVLEHVENGVAFFESLIAQYSPHVIVFSTQTFNTVPASDWWYYAFEEGQHITFYQPRTLRHLADRLGYSYHPLSSELHLFIRPAVSLRFSRVLRHSRLRGMYSWVVRRGLQSKTWADHKAVLGHRNEN